MAGNNQRTIIIYISFPLLAHRADGAMSKKRMVRREGLGGLLRLQTINDLPGIMNVGWRRLIAVIGTWLSRDPIYSPTGQQYGYADNNPVSKTDPSGLMISVDPVYPAAWRVGMSYASASSNGIVQTGCCGASDVYWDFAVSPTTTRCNGGLAYFIQLVNFQMDVSTSCANSIPSTLTCNNDKLQYLEVWNDSTGSGRTDMSRKVQYSDRFWLPPCIFTAGSSKKSGLVKYFCASELPYPGPNQLTALNFNGGRCTPSSGKSLPCQDITAVNPIPSWWFDKDRSGGPGVHNLSAAWNCCCPDNYNAMGWSSTMADPSPTLQTTPPCGR